MFTDLLLDSSSIPSKIKRETTITNKRQRHLSLWLPVLHLHQVIWIDTRLDILELTLHLYFKCEGAAAVCSLKNNEGSSTKIYSLGELDAMVAAGRIVVAYRVNSSMWIAWRYLIKGLPVTEYIMHYCLHFAGESVRHDALHRSPRRGGEAADGRG